MDAQLRGCYQSAGLIDALALTIQGLSHLYIAALGALLEWRVYVLLPLVPAAFYKSFKK